MTRLVLLGTDGGPRPKPHRAAPANLVEHEGQLFVIDCGNGVARQAVRAGYELRQLRATFITHHHSDHNADYGNLLLLAWAAGLSTNVDTYGPPPLAAMTHHYLAMNATDIDIRVTDEGRPPLGPLITPHEVDAPGIVYDDGALRVTATLVNHPPVVPALAYRFDTPQRSIVFSGDTVYSPALVDLAKGADVLVHEAMHTPALWQATQDTNGATLTEHLLASHTPTDLAGRVAQEAGVSTLVLTHFVPGDEGVPKETWQKEAQRTFHGKVVVGHDLLSL